MLSFNTIGKHERLANQMFRYAALFSLAKRRGFEFIVPPSSMRKQWPGYQIFDAFQLPGVQQVGFSRDFTTVRPRDFSYDAALAETCPDNVDLRGYFQSEKYFHDCAMAIRDEFAFHPEAVAEADERLAGIAGPRISLHIRRGDYLRNSRRHPVLGLDYYASALERTPPDLPVMVFSDDIRWCKKQKLFRGERFVFSEKASNVVDLRLMSLCDHHIIANSSFSWWGAWLAGNPDKIVVAPKRWFGPVYANLDTRDLVPAGWIKLA